MSPTQTKCSSTLPSSAGNALNLRIAESTRSIAEKKVSPHAHHPPASEPEIPLIRIFETRLGWIGFRWSAAGLTALTFGHISREEVLMQPGYSPAENLDEKNLDRLRSIQFTDDFGEPEWVAEATELLIAYAAGEPVDLSLIPCQLPQGTHFEQRVRDQLRKIPYGQTMTYGQLAQAAGAPRAARAVGSVMARNQIPLVLPCHRVVAAAGKLGGYSAHSGLSMKERLLRLEQAPVSR